MVNSQKKIFFKANNRIKVGRIGLGVKFNEQVIRKRKQKGYFGNF